MSSVFENAEIRSRLRHAFPDFYVNANYEIIIYPPRNSYFLIENVTSQEELNAKILEWLSREACKSPSEKSMRYHQNGINDFLATTFSDLDFEQIYTYIGNRVNHDLTIRFIRSGYDMAVLPVCDFILEERWNELDGIAFDDKAQDEDLKLAEDWWRFKKGTEREEIWSFFDENYSGGVKTLFWRRKKEDKKEEDHEHHKN